MSDVGSKTKAEGTMLITYCDRCGVRMCGENVGDVCEECQAGRGRPRYRAADSSQIPFVEVPEDSEVLRTVRENMSTPE